MVLLYNIGLRLYSFFIRLVSPFNPKAKLFIDGRKNVFESVTEFKKAESKPVAWFHAASLGEFEQGLPVMQAFKKEYPHYSIAVSFFSPSGFEQKKNHEIADFSCYLPIDTAANARLYLDTLRPSVVFFIKYEYWYHYLNEINKRAIPLYSISALFTPNHIFFKAYGGFHRRMLKFFKHTFVQNSNSEKLLREIGIEACSVSGDTRFDRVTQTLNKPATFQEIKRFVGDFPCLIIGSAWPEDMEVLEDFINKEAENLKIIIAPHLIDSDHLDKITGYLKVPYQLYTESRSEVNGNILVLNTIGMLASTYQYASFAYIGGAFGDGLHNILEAVAFGLPVVFGNKGLDKFPESLELISLGGAFSVSDKISANNVLRKLLNESFRKEASNICIKYVEENTGATEKIMSYLSEDLK